MTTDPRKAREAADELRAAVDALCKPRTTKIMAADGTVQTGTIPALWDQACDALADSREDSSGGKPGSRPPYDIDLADYLNDIRQSVRHEAMQRRLTPRNNIHADLRQIVEYEAGQAEVNVLRLWTYKVTDWTSGLARRLGQVEGRALSIRDSTCPNCGHSHVTVTDDDDWTRVEPALILPTPPLPVAICRACGQQWSDRDGLFDLAYGIENVRGAEPRHADTAVSLDGLTAATA